MKANWFALFALLAGAASAAQVDFFSPQGEVKGVRQVAVRFSDPMVAFGDPRLPEPFEINCPAPGKARWADQKNWVYDFDRDLPAGLRCAFSLKSDLVSLAGNKPDGNRTFEFSTGGPAIVQMMPYEGNRIDEEQIFLLGLDAPATGQSITDNVFCDIGGTTERVPVRLIEGEERKTLLAARRDFVDRFLYVLFKDGREIVIDGRPFGKGTRFEQFLSADGGGKFPIAVLQCKRRLPNKAQVRLVWGKGIVSDSGVPTSQDQILEYEVRETFQAKFTCDRVNKDAQCLPILPMRLSFTAPVSRSVAEKIVLKAQGKTIAAGLPDIKIRCK